MKRKVYYKQEYKIVINDRFYEVIDGKTVLYYDELKHEPTIQEVWNRTVGTEHYVDYTQQRINDYRRSYQKHREPQYL